MSQAVDRALTVRAKLSILRPYLDMEDVTEVAVNRCGAVWVEGKGGWRKYDDSKITYRALQELGTASAVFAGAGNVFDGAHPILSADLPDGERIQFVMPPACTKDAISLTIRKIARSVIELSSYEEQGFFRHLRKKDGADPTDEELLGYFGNIRNPNVKLAEKARVNFLRRAVELGKTIVIAGETGSGKTTFMKALMQHIPTSERIITIEDVPELVYGLPKHENLVNLFYPSEATEVSTVTAASLMRSCLRMKPDRILLAELRGGETYDFLNVCLSGHRGSITSCHAGSCEQVFDYLALKVLQSPTGRELPYNVIEGLLRQVIDIVVHVHRDRELGRHITDMYFKAAGGSNEV